MTGQLISEDKPHPLRLNRQTHSSISPNQESNSMDCPPLATVCQLCRELLIPEINPHDDQTSSGERESYRDRQTLKHSVDQGCFLCSRIWELLEPLDEQTTPNGEDSLSPPDKSNNKRLVGAVVACDCEEGHFEELKIVIDTPIFQSSTVRRYGVFFVLKPSDGTIPTSYFCNAISDIGRILEYWCRETAPGKRKIPRDVVHGRGMDLKLRQKPLRMQ